MRRISGNIPLILGYSVVALFFPLGASFLSVLWQGIAYAACAVLLAVPMLTLKYQRSAVSDRTSELKPVLWWFLIIHLYYPVGVVLSIVLPFSFLGVTYLPAVLLLIFLMIKIPSWRPSSKWFRFGSLDKLSIALICIVSLFSGIALFLWVRFLRPDLASFLDMMPKAGIFLLLLSGLGFAFSNAFVEEMFFRGFLWHGLAGSKWTQLTGTAVLFGMLHIRGFPGGVVGIGMVFVWGIFLGILRRRSQGMLAPYLAHVAADMTIFGILCGLYY